MTSLEQIVLPLEQSRALVEKGIVLDTAMVWAEMDGGYQCDENGDPQQEMPPYADVVPGDSPYHGTFICPAPTLGELLDAIRAKYPLATVMMTWMGAYWDASFGDYLVQMHKTTHGDTYLLAAAALLMEVSK